MKIFMVVASLVVLSSAEPPSSYGTPSRYQASEPAYGVPAAGHAPSGGYSGGYESAPSGGYGPQGGQVFKHVYVHAAPDEPVYAENKVIRVPGGGDKHVNIIFVKAPSHSSNQQTEVILPEQPQQKTVVYVLVKKPSYNNNVKVTGPGPARPQKPEVFFIRYADKAGGAYGPPPSAPVYAPSAPVYAAPPSQEYGPQAPPTQGGYQ